MGAPVDESHDALTCAGIDTHIVAPRDSGMPSQHVRARAHEARDMALHFTSEHGWSSRAESCDAQCVAPPTRRLTWTWSSSPRALPPPWPAPAHRPRFLPFLCWSELGLQRRVKDGRTTASSGAARPPCSRPARPTAPPRCDFAYTSCSVFCTYRHVGLTHAPRGFGFAQIPYNGGWCVLHMVSGSCAKLKPTQSKPRKCVASQTRAV